MVVLVAGGLITKPPFMYPSMHCSFCLSYGSRDDHVRTAFLTKRVDLTGAGCKHNSRLSGSSTRGNVSDARAAVKSDTTALVHWVQCMCLTPASTLMTRISGVLDRRKATVSFCPCLRSHAQERMAQPRVAGRLAIGESPVACGCLVGRIRGERRAGCGSPGAGGWSSELRAQSSEQGPEAECRGKT